MERNDALLLRAANLLPTRQRIALLQTLRNATGPLSAEAICAAVPVPMNLSTVYRALEQLITAGLARRVELRGNHALFEASGSHHHHVTCRSCGQMKDVSVCMPSPARTALKKVRGFATVDDHSLEFFGLCTMCARLS